MQQNRRYTLIIAVPYSCLAMMARRMSSPSRLRQTSDGAHNRAEVCFVHLHKRIGAERPYFGQSSLDELTRMEKSTEGPKSVVFGNAPVRYNLSRLDMLARDVLRGLVD